MRCIGVDEHQNLYVTQTDMPVCERGEVLIRVAFAGVNRPDLLQRRGLYPPPTGHSPILGLEVAGEIVAVGSGVEASWVGKRVCALCNGGGYAEFVSVPLGQVIEIPPSLPTREAAALPEALFTAYINVFQLGKLAPGETLLIQGGSGGVGHIALQMAKLTGATVAVTAGSEEKVNFCRSLGADLAINYRQQDFAEQCRQHSMQPDLVLDCVGGDYVSKHLALLKTEGRIVQIAFLRGSAVSVDLMPMMLKRITMTGSTLRARSAEFKQSCRDDILERWWPLVATAELRPRIECEFPLEDAAEAHRSLDDGEVMGKVLLSL